MDSEQLQCKKCPSFYNVIRLKQSSRPQEGGTTSGNKYSHKYRPFYEIHVFLGQKREIFSKGRVMPPDRDGDDRPL